MTFFRKIVASDAPSAVILRILALVAALSCACLTFAGDGGSKRITFEEAKVDTLPQGWKKAKTGKGTGGAWKIVEDKDAAGGLALAQTKADKGAMFNICVAEQTTYKDIDLTVSFKAMAGDVDQGGGPVWRFQDGNNYLIARMNPLEDNFRLYKVVAGKRIQLESADVKAAAGKWHTIRIVHRGDHIECYLNGTKHLDAKDDTFKDAGKIGVWSKADAQTRFSDLTIKGK